MRYNLEMLKRPKPFEQGNMTLWDDEYIASNVLKKHLQGDIDSGSRKKTTIVKTIKWINDMFPIKGNLLDIGCGPGLYAKDLAGCGFCYHGIDISAYQIAFAEKNFRDDNAIFEIVDFRKLALNRLYDTVLMSYGIYSFYCPHERIKLLRTIRDSLTPNGKVIVEVFTDYHYIDRKEATDWEYVEKNGFWGNEPYLELNAFYKYADLELVLIQAAKIDDTVKVWNSWIQTFTPDTLKSEFELAGFSEFEFYSSCTGNPYYESTDVLCMIAG